MDKAKLLNYKPNVKLKSKVANIKHVSEYLPKIINDILLKNKRENSPTNCK